MLRSLLFSVLALSSFFSFGQTLFQITTQPAATLSICQDYNGSLSISSNGNFDRVYQWQKFNTATNAWVNLTNSSSYTNATTTLTGTNRNTVTTFTISTKVTGAAGAGRYRCIVSDGSSSITSSESVVTILSQPPTPTGTDGYACSSPSSVVLTANGATGTQTYQWYYGGKPINGEINATYTTPAITTNTTYYVTIDNGACESAQVAVVAQILTPPTAPTVTNGSACGSSTVVLSASGGTNGQYRWYNTAAKTPIPGETNSTYTTPSISATTNYSVSIYNGFCESSRVTVTATINTVPAAPTASGSAACGSSSLTLGAAGGSAGQYRWYTTSSGGTAIAGQTNSSYTTPTLTTTTTYFVAINNGTCESLRTSVTAQINTVPAAPVTTGNASCSASALTLAASGGNAGQYRWYTSASSQALPMSGETNSTYTTAVNSVTTTYYVSINDGTCEGARSPVTAVINTPPTAPTTTDNSLCTEGRVALMAAGAKDGNYRWYMASTGGQPLSGEVNAKFLTPSISSTTTYYASINDGNCESTSRTPAVAIIGGANCNNAPVIESEPIVTQIEGKVTLDLTLLISDKDKNLDLNTLRVIVPPHSGAAATITSNYSLLLDYKGISFSGEEKLTIEVCDLDGACTQQELSVEVAGDIIVYNAVSPNNDKKNDSFRIEYINVIDNTKKNHVYIFGRWGDVLFDISDYDNDTKVFKGLNNNGDEIPSGTYFYKIEFASGKSAKTGYLTLKR